MILGLIYRMLLGWKYISFSPLCSKSLHKKARQPQVITEADRQEKAISRFKETHVKAIPISRWFRIKTSSSLPNRNVPSLTRIILSSPIHQLYLEVIHQLFVVSLTFISLRLRFPDMLLFNANNSEFINPWKARLGKLMNCRSG